MNEGLEGGEQAVLRFGRKFANQESDSVQSFINLTLIVFLVTF
jgi:hypothetical protein